MQPLARLLISLSLAVATAGCQAQPQRQYTSNDSVNHYDVELTRAELHQLLAPIALYPDTVLSHILIASTYPLEVVQASRWANANSRLSAEQALDAATTEPWDPSVQALVAFPDLLARMSDDLQWTQQLGDAFLFSDAQVMDAIQELRDKAYAAGSLKQMKHVTVQRREKIIIIEPAIERVVYIPYYDPHVVYGSWHWPHHPPTYWSHPRDHLYIGGFYWGPRAHLSTSFFFTSFHWHQHRVVHIDRRHHSPRRYTSSHIARFDGARTWRHNPVHRRGVDYRHQSVRQHYNRRTATSRDLHPQQRQVQAERRTFVKPRGDGAPASRPRANELREQLRDNSGQARTRPVRAEQNREPVRRFSNQVEQQGEQRRSATDSDASAPPAPKVERRAELQRSREVQVRREPQTERSQSTTAAEPNRSRDTAPARPQVRTEAAPRREALRERAAPSPERRPEANRAPSPRPAARGNNDTRERRTWTRPQRD